MSGHDDRLLPSNDVSLFCDPLAWPADYRRGYCDVVAFPHNAQLEIMDPTLIQAGIQLTHDLDDRFGLPHKHTLSQRDVPGMTRSIIPIIKEYGVDAITVGANDGSTPPNVPDVKGGRDWTAPMPFVWEDPVSGEDILAMWNWPGYGSYPHNPPVLVPGLDHALVYNFAGDNVSAAPLCLFQVVARTG